LENIDYSNYSLEELYDVERSIDAKVYPQRYREVLSKIRQKSSQKTNSESSRHGASVKTSFKEDPLAKLTSWEPLVSGGSNFATHTLKRTSRSKLEFTPSVGSYLLTLTFALVSAITLFKLNESYLLSWQWPPNFDETMQLLLPALFVGATLYMIYKLSEGIVFDRKRGVYWKGQKEPSRVSLSNKGGKHTRISEIHAIQLLAELCNGGKNADFYSFELNLVLKNGQRLSVIDHGNEQKIRNDCNMLAKFLSVPIWEYAEVKERSPFAKLFRWKL